MLEYPKFKTEIISDSKITYETRGAFPLDENKGDRELGKLEIERSETSILIFTIEFRILWKNYEGHEYKFTSTKKIKAWEVDYGDLIKETEKLIWSVVTAYRTEAMEYEDNLIKLSAGYAIPFHLFEIEDQIKAALRLASLYHETEV